MKTVKVDENGAVDLHKMLEGTNTSPDQVEYYHMEQKDGVLKVALFDKDKKFIQVELLPETTLEQHADGVKEVRSNYDQAMDYYMGMCDDD